MREAAIASRIRPWIGEWLASDQTDTGGASPPAPKAAASAGLASQTSATLQLGRDISAECATGPAAKARPVRPVGNCWIRFAVGRSDARRGGKEGVSTCRSGGSPYDYQKKGRGTEHTEVR